MTDLLTPLTDKQLAQRRTRHERSRVVSKSVNTLLAWCVAVLFSFPLIWTFFTALKPPSEVFGRRIEFIGSEVRWGNFIAAWHEVNFGRLLLNSVSVAFISTFIAVTVATLSAFAFSRLKFRGRDPLFVLFILTLTLPTEIAVVPLFLGFDAVRLTDTWAALILPGLFGAFGAFLLRQFMLQIPAEMEEAARIDGASTWGIFTRITLPLVRPAISVLAIFSFLGSWNSFLWPLIILNSADKWTIPIGLAGFSSMTGTRWELLMAACVLTVLPVIIVVSAAQRQLVAAISAGAFGGR